MKQLINQYSFGVGDRFTYQAKAQLKAILMAKDLGCEITPVWNKSYREHEIIGSKSIDTKEKVDNAISEFEWDDSYLLDADHINMNNVDFFINTCDFYTIDVADYIGRPIETKILSEFYNRNEKYLGQLDLPRLYSIDVTPDLIMSVAKKYLVAVLEAGNIYRYIRSKIGGKPFVVEVSMDETDKPQTPDELFFILSAISDQNIPINTIAPKFSGRFNKGVDYVGDLKLFEKEFEENVAVIQLAINEFSLNKDLKLSIHSGSDKFSIYPIMNRIVKKYNTGLHLKTAGTSWLEELIGLSESGNDGLEIAKRIYIDSLKHYDELCMPYLTVIDIDKTKLPTINEINLWDGKIFSESLRHDQKNPNYNLHFRQLLHVGYKIASKLGKEYLSALRINEKVISKNVTENIFYRHIKPLFLD